MPRTHRTETRSSLGSQALGSWSARSLGPGPSTCGPHVCWDFALGNLPWWPFATYVLLTIGGLAPLGIGLLAGDYAAWLGWLVLAADVLFLGLYLAMRDIPPFVFYLLLLVVGIAIF